MGIAGAAVATAAGQIRNIGRCKKTLSSAIYFGLVWFWMTFPVTEVITSAVGVRSCVIVGRSADWVLKDYENMVRIFIHAPEEYRISRGMEVYGDSREEAKKNILRSDRNCPSNSSSFFTLHRKTCMLE